MPFQFIKLLAGKESSGQKEIIRILDKGRYPLTHLPEKVFQLIHLPIARTLNLQASQ